VQLLQALRGRWHQRLLQVLAAHAQDGHLGVGLRIWGGEIWAGGGGRGFDECVAAMLWVSHSAGPGMQRLQGVEQRPTGSGQACPLIADHT